MEQVRRWDTGAVGKVERTDQGYLRAPATITKVGVFAYKLPGGKIRRELRLPDEVFNADALRSFALAPLTDGHPRQNTGEPIMLNARNTARYQVGSVVEPHQDGDGVSAVVQITDDAAIKAAENGKRQISCGYNCGLEFTPGVTQGIPGVPDGLHYDAIQRDICGNHVALVSKGRAGADVQLRLDAADGFQVEPDEQSQNATRADSRPRGENMEAQVRIDGVGYDCTPQVAEAVGKLQARLDELEKAAAETATQLAEQRARADAAEESLAAEKKAHADALSPDKVRDAVNARLALERTAAPILGDEVKIDGMADDEIKAAVVVACATDQELAKQRLDGCEAAYLQARYDAAVEAHVEAEKPNEGLKQTRKAARSASRTDSADDARQRMIERNQKLGRTELARKDVH
jgi:hypothetical protein